MKVGAPYGNKNAEKWSFRKAAQLFSDAIELSQKKEKTKNTVYSYDFIGEIARELGTFKEIFSHLESRFPVLSRKHKQLITNLESNCYYNTKKGNIREATGIVNLKSNHKWTDRNDQNVIHSGEIKTTPLTPEVAKAISKNIDENM